MKTKTIWMEKTIWTDAHHPKVNKYLLELSDGTRVNYTQLEVLGQIKSDRVEDMQGNLITNSGIIKIVREHVGKHPGPQK